MAAITNGDHPDATVSGDSAYVKELQKNMRNITKKLASTHKTDAVIAENPGVSLEDLLAQRKINADQKASVLKKPQLQAQLAQLEEQIQHYRKSDSEYRTQLSKQKEELSSAHAQELEKAREEARQQERSAQESTLRSKLLLFSQFLRAAAAKRAEEESVDSDESKAFEGALLLVYGGDNAAVDAALKIIEGSSEKTPSIDGTVTSVSYASIKQASIDHSPFQHEEAWVESVAEAQASSLPAGSDPTLTHAGLTELEGSQTVSALKATDEQVSQPISTDAANAAGDRWDTNGTSRSADDGALEESYEVIPRPNEEVDIPTAASIDHAAAPASLTDTALDANASASWADQVPAYETAAAAATAVPVGDGFQEVPGRTRGRGGRGGHHHRGDGEHRGRGRGQHHRGDGEFRGRGRGGRGDGEHRGRGDHGHRRGDGEHRGRGGRGRGGPRGDGPPAPRT